MDWVIKDTFLLWLLGRRDISGPWQRQSIKRREVQLGRKNRNVREILFWFVDSEAREK